MSTRGHQSFRSRLLGLALISAFPLAICCSVVTGTALVDRYQASGTYLAPLPLPQIGSCPDCSSVPGMSGAARTAPGGDVVPSVKSPVDRSPALRPGRQ